jgi:uncharacterized protein
VHFTGKITSDATDCGWVQRAATGFAVQPLARGHEKEVLAFLARRPLHTFGLVGLIKSNGIVSPLNRGTFYGYRDSQGQLLGVALMGRATLFETDRETVIEAFASVARNHPEIYFLLGESDKMNAFWDHYGERRAAAFVPYDLLVKRGGGPEIKGPICALRQATLNDLDAVVMAHARSGIEETGNNALLEDMAGFVNRCARRIEIGQTWILIDGGKLVFKVDVLTCTPDVAYLEAVWVDPDERDKGYGSRCILELNRILLRHTNAICLLADAQNHAARSLYRKTGYAPVSPYKVIFL